MPKLKTRKTAKYKLKTHRATAKRITITATGKLLRERRGDKHFNQKKRASRKRATAVEAIVKGAIAKNVKRALGVA